MKAQIELSFVVPVYNGSRTISRIVERIDELYSDIDFEIVLVNDGSSDDSEQACLALVGRYPKTVQFLQLARNFGEHSAVLAGLNHARAAPTWRSSMTTGKTRLKRCGSLYRRDPR